MNLDRKYYPMTYSNELLANLDNHVEDPDFAGWLADILVRLDQPARGISQQVLGKGLQTLSARQRNVFETHVIDQYAIAHCKRCCSPIPWCEMDIGYETGYCGWCAHMEEKMMAE